jgi:hypothetical protein
MPRHIGHLGLVVALGSGIQAVAAQPVEPQASSPDAQAQIDELKEAIAVRDRVIRNLIARVEQLERRVSAAPDAGEALIAAPSEPAEGPSPQPTVAPEPIDQQLIRAAFERTLIDRGGLLLSKGTWELEPSLAYAHSSSESLVIDGFTIFPVLVVGDIFSQRLRRNSATTALTGRVGLPWKSQLEVRVPWVSENHSTLTGDGEELKVSDHGVGDFEIALSRDLPRLFGRGPQLLGSLRWKSARAEDPFDLRERQLPFGSGFRSATASLTGVSVLDPVVLFGTFSYTDALAAHKGETYIEPGDSLGLQIGMALSLNLETSLSFAYQQSSTDRTHVDGVEVPGTYLNTGALSIGLARAFASGRSLDTTLVVGLSQDSPDLQLAFSMPFRRTRAPSAVP